MGSRGKAGGSTSNVVTPPNENITLTHESDGKTIESYYDSHGFKVSDIIDTASHSVLVDSMQSLNNIINELPDTVKSELLSNGNIKIIWDDNPGNSYASTRAMYVINGNPEIYLSEKMFGQGREDRIASDYAWDVNQKFHPSNTTHADIISHEFGHILEAYICKKLSPGSWGGNSNGTWNAKMAWMDNVYSKQIVEDAFNSVRGQLRTAGGSPVKTATAAMKTISKYAGYSKTKGYHEAVAEAVSDYASNGNNASPLSLAIWKNIKALL